MCAWENICEFKRKGLRDMSFVIGLKQAQDSKLALVGESKFKSVAERLASMLYHKYSVDSSRVIEADLNGRVPGEVFNEIMKLERKCKHPNQQATFDRGLVCADCGLRIRNFDEVKVIEDVANANIELEELEYSESWG